jgi:hypothetical protein
MISTTKVKVKKLKVLTSYLKKTRGYKPLVFLWTDTFYGSVLFKFYCISDVI